MKRSKLILTNIVMLSISIIALYFTFFQSYGQSQINVSRSISDPVYPGESFEVTINLHSEGTAKNISVRENTDNLTVVSAPGGSIHENVVSWYIPDFEGNRTLAYTVSAPIGQYQDFKLSGEFQNSVVDRSIGGESWVNITS